MKKEEILEKIAMLQQISDWFSTKTCEVEREDRKLLLRHCCTYTNKAISELKFLLKYFKWTGKQYPNMVGILGELVTAHRYGKYHDN